MEEKLQAFKDLLSTHQRIVFFGGAGVSTESGIPDFRSVDGLYHQQYDYPPETILSHTFFMTHPDEFYRFYRNKMLVLDKKPNPAHLALAKLEEQGKLLSVVTQNIDGLHQAAGSKRVWELHGSIHRNYCMKCHKFYSGEDLLSLEDTPRCTCGGLIKPDVVLYEEPLDNDTIDGAVRDIASADLLIIGGTSLAVYPAAGLIHYYRGKDLVLINRDPTPADRMATLLLSGNIGEIFQKVCLDEE